MDAGRFDRLAQTWVVHSRRRALLAALAAALGGPLALLNQRQVTAGCREPGRDCRRGHQCCSGRCRGQRGEKKCRRVSSQDICSIRAAYCATAHSPTLCGEDCGCWQRANGTAFCGSLIVVTCAEDGKCANCPIGSVCVNGRLCCPVGGHAICVQPCPHP